MTSERRACENSGPLLHQLICFDTGAARRRPGCCESRAPLWLILFCGNWNNEVMFFDTFRPVFTNRQVNKGCADPTLSSMISMPVPILSINPIPVHRVMNLFRAVMWGRGELSLQKLSQYNKETVFKVDRMGWGWYLICFITSESALIGADLQISPGNCRAFRKIWNN